jgi:hypothetical protein
MPSEGNAMKRLRAQITYANVISTLCLVLLLGGGTAYAATQMLPKNSVGAKQIKKGSITPAKLAASALTALAGSPGPRGATGPQGAPGTPGTAGAPGAPGATKVSVQLGPEGIRSYAHCPSGQVAVGGGGDVANEESFLWSSEPIVGTEAAQAGQTPNGWFAAAEDATGTEQPVTAYVVCASP